MAYPITDGSLPLKKYVYQLLIVFEYPEDF